MMYLNTQIMNLSQHIVPKNTRLSVFSGSVINRIGHKGIPVNMQRVAATLAILIMAPIFLATICLIKMESQGKCFYKQTRVGKHGRRFSMYKFRSMYEKTDPRYAEPDPSDSDRDGVCKKYKKDPRITKVGAFIRKFSIDELPQLWNIARGDMVMVGPRPALIDEVNAYSEEALVRLNGLPGLSGLWQVSGRADTDFETQVTLDETYLAQQSVWLDIQILLKTVPCVIFAKGAY